MTKPDLHLLAKWLDTGIVEELDRKRRMSKECRRNRKLGTLGTLWLMLAVSLDTARSSLHEILRLATGELNIEWSVSVPAFCKARSRFSPGSPILVTWPTDIATAKSLWEQAHSLARLASCRLRQDQFDSARISTPLEVFRRTWGISGIGTDCR
jgi:hypothetical protein